MYRNISPAAQDHRDDHDAGVVNLNEARGPDPGFKHRWLDRLQDADPPRHSIFALAYALTRFPAAKAKTPKVFSTMAKIAARAHVSLPVAKRDIKWLHDHGWLAFGTLSIEELAALRVRSNDELITKVRVLTLPGADHAPQHREKPPEEPDLFDEGDGSPAIWGGGSPAIRGVDRPRSTESTTLGTLKERERAREKKAALQGRTKPAARSRSTIGRPLRETPPSQSTKAGAPSASVKNLPIITSPADPQRRRSGRRAGEAGSGDATTSAGSNTSRHHRRRRHRERSSRRRRSWRLSPKCSALMPGSINRRVI